LHLVLGAGAAPKEETAVREILDVPVGDLMWKAVVTVRPETSLNDLERLMTTHPYNGFPVVTEAGVLQGMVTRLDVLKLYLLPYQRFIPALEDIWASSVAAIMNAAVITLNPAESALKAVALMVDYRIRTIPIVTDTVAGPALAGIITRRDLAPALKV
jgi:CBS domain-containing protein